MQRDSIVRSLPKVAIAAAVFGTLYDLPHFAFDEDLSKSYDAALFTPHGVAGIIAMSLALVVLGGLFAVLVASESGENERDGLAPIAFGLATIGTVAVAGGVWAESILVPYIARIDASVVAGDPGASLIAAIVIGVVVFIAGWVLVAVSLRRRALISKGAAIALAVGSLLHLAPLPGSALPFFVILAVVVTGMTKSPVGVAAGSQHSAAVPA